MAQITTKEPSWSEFADFGSFFKSIENDLSLHGVVKVGLGKSVR